MFVPYMSLVKTEQVFVKRTACSFRNSHHYIALRKRTMQVSQQAHTAWPYGMQRKGRLIRCTRKGRRKNSALQLWWELACGSLQIKTGNSGSRRGQQMQLKATEATQETKQVEQCSTAEVAPSQPPTADSDHSPYSSQTPLHALTNISSLI